MKPFSIARREFEETLAELINNSGLPASVMRDILSNAVTATAQLAEAQYNNDIAQWKGDSDGECNSDDEDNVPG